MVWPYVRWRQRRGVVQPGDLELCGQQMDRAGLLQQHLLLRPEPAPGQAIQVPCAGRQHVRSGGARCRVCACHSWCGEGER